MQLTASQQAVAFRFLEDWKKSGMTLENQGETFPFKEFDKKRMLCIEKIDDVLENFLSKRMSLTAFREANDVLSREHAYWGFNGFSGQMFLNQLVNWSNASEEMSAVLREGLGQPRDQAEASEKIEALCQGIPKLVAPERSLRLGSVSFLLSYFWQIHEPDKIPVCYSSQKAVFSSAGILESSDAHGAYFTNYWDANDALGALYRKSENLNEINVYWFVEHVLWANRRVDGENPESRTTRGRAHSEGSEHGRKNNFMQFIPPVLEDFLELARGDGTSLVFEGKVMKFFKMLGFQVEEMGQGQGRKPDGVALCRELNFAILFDAKSFRDGYQIGTDDRKIIEYIKSQERRLRKEGYHNFYFVAVSSSFRGDAKQALDRVRNETQVKSVVLLTAEQGLRVLARKIEKPASFDLESLRDLLVDSGQLSDEALEQFLES